MTGNQVETDWLGSWTAEPVKDEMHGFVMMVTVQPLLVVQASCLPFWRGGAHRRARCPHHNTTHPDQSSG